MSWSAFAYLGFRALAIGISQLVACAVTASGHAQSLVSTPLPVQIVGAFDTMFAGPHPTLRAVHAKGLLCDGVFTPAWSARSLSYAKHFAGGAAPVLVRFSNFAAVPGMPDGNPAASPRGMSVKFVLPGDETTDIVAHSYNGFPARSAEDFLGFLQAVPNREALEQFASSHPAARAFLDDPKPAPASYGTETYFGVNAFRFTNEANTSVVGRYRFVPLAGVHYLSVEAAAVSEPNYLLTAMEDQLRHGPVGFRVELQIAGEGDVVEDGSVAWPDDRPTVEIGEIRLVALTPMQDALQPNLRFTPTNIVDGISLTDDPMLLARTQAYRVSAQRRGNER